MLSGYMTREIVQVLQNLMKKLQHWMRSRGLLVEPPPTQRVPDRDRGLRVKKTRDEAVDILKGRR